MFNPIISGLTHLILTDCSKLSAAMTDYSAFDFMVFLLLNWTHHS